MPKDRSVFLRYASCFLMKGVNYFVTAAANLASTVLIWVDIVHSLMQIVDRPPVTILI